MTFANRFNKEIKNFFILFGDLNLRLDIIFFSEIVGYVL